MANENHVNIVQYMKGDQMLAVSFMEMGEDYMSSEPRDLRIKFLKSILDLQGEPDRWLYFPQIDAEPVGFTHLKVDKTDRPGWGWILEFYIKPKYRRKGWGRHLYTESTKQFKEKFNQWLTSNPEAIPFWKSLGFKETGEIADNNYSVMIKTVNALPF